MGKDSTPKAVTRAADKRRGHHPGDTIVRRGGQSKKKDVFVAGRDVPLFDALRNDHRQQNQQGVQAGRQEQVDLASTRLYTQRGRDGKVITYFVEGHEASRTVRELSGPAREMYDRLVRQFLVTHPDRERNLGVIATTVDIVLAADVPLTSVEEGRPNDLASNKGAVDLAVKMFRANMAWAGAQLYGNKPSGRR